MTANILKSACIEWSKHALQTLIYKYIKVTCLQELHKNTLNIARLLLNYKYKDNLMLTNVDLPVWWRG